MGIISHFNFIHIFPPLMWAWSENLYFRECLTGSQTELQYSVSYAAEKVSWWTYSDRISYSFTQKWKVIESIYLCSLYSKWNIHIQFQYYHMYYCQLQKVLLATSVNVVLMPDDGPQDRNMWHLLTKLIKFGSWH
jgi:hypothetical protein